MKPTSQQRYALNKNNGQLNFELKTIPSHLAVHTEKLANVLPRYLMNS